MMPEPLQSLELAIAHGDLAEVVTLLDQQPDLLHSHFLENIGLTPLMWACRNRRDSIVEELLARGSEVNGTNTREPSGDGGNTALWFTAQGSPEGTVHIASLLLDHGAQINTQCERGTTALYMAVSWVHMDLVQYLLSRGANPMLADDEGMTALDRLRSDYGWYAEQTTLTADQEKLLQRAPRMIAFLERIAAGNVLHPQPQLAIR